MPSAIIHRCVSKKVEEKINKFKIKEDKYIYDVASIAPDSWRNTERFKNSDLPKREKRMYSHFSNKDNFLEQYNLFKEKYKKDLDNPFIFGYLIHLMTDNFWRKEMHTKKMDITKPIDELASLEEKSDLNKDIEVLTKDISKYYEINELRELTKEEIESFPVMEEITYDGINATINFTNNQLKNKVDRKTIEYTIEDIISGIDACVNRIINEIGEL